MLYYNCLNSKTAFYLLKLANASMEENLIFSREKNAKVNPNSHLPDQPAD